MCSNTFVEGEASRSCFSTLVTRWSKSKVQTFNTLFVNLPFIAQKMYIFLSNNLSFMYIQQRWKKSRFAK